MVKTITIDMEAYTRLARAKGKGQSFSDVIKTHFTPTPTAGRLKALLRQVPALDAETLDHLDRIVADRRHEKARYRAL